MPALARTLYSLLMVLLQPLLRLRLAQRARAEPLYGQWVDERFGRYSSAAPAREREAPLLWLHAVSLGETRAAAVLVAELRALRPGLRLLLTHGTATGRAEGQRLCRPGDVQVWQPWDTPGAVARFLAHHRPTLGVLMETEIWPNLVAGCAARGVPLVLANARLNARSLAGAERLTLLSRPAYAALHAVYAQTDADAQRLRLLGAPVQAVTGNLKFDATPDAAQVALGRSWRAARAEARPVLLLASSREGEEVAWLDALQQLDAAQRQSVRWLVVPRHPQRFDEVAALITARGFAVQRRSACGDTLPDTTTAPPDAVLLGDSLGEMAAYYSLADVALLGGSFAPLGGQNLIEAAACGCPLVLGPHTFNFAEAAEQALQAGAALRASDLADALRQALALALAADAPRRAAMAGASRSFAQAHRGAARQTAERLLAELDAAAARRRG